MSRNIVFIFATIADPVEMPPYTAFYLSLPYLLKHLYIMDWFTEYKRKSTIWQSLTTKQSISSDDKNKSNKDQA